MQIFKNKNFYFLLSFIEGGSVMAAELLGAKMLAPYFGSSLYVWASVLAITLGGLAVGYYAGGIVSYKSKNPLTLFYVLLAAAAFTVLMPFSSKMILWVVGSHSLIPSVIVSASCILFPPVFMMGMVSPLIIRAITVDVEQSGRAAGAIYAVSTVGGILATFTFGFYIIPNFGLTLPAILTGIVLGIIPLFVIIKQKQIAKAAGFFLLCVWAISIASQSFSSNIKRVYAEEGLLGQVAVLDYPHYNKDTVLDGYSRWLFVNRVSQTMYDSLADETNGEEKYFTYVYRISDYVDSFPKASKSLLIGLGGGSVAKKLIEKGFDVDVCELDQRIADVAREYFYLSPKVNIKVDDGRHFIRNCKKKYDIIVLDMFKGEDPPNHVFTIESLTALKEMLNPDGIIFVNSLGYFEGSIGKSMRSVYKTFQAAGFNVKALTTDPNPDQRNILFYASTGAIQSHPDFIDEKNMDLKDAVVLKDEYPVLDILNAEAAQRWRVMAIQSFNVDPNQRVLPIFE
ncbi:MAG: fused MFS/spermidine synthase [Bacteroidetes bacterium]|nr:fused MFS/spermidine synthase [Bacteroidota bacterium]